MPDRTRGSALGTKRNSSELWHIAFISRKQRGMTSDNSVKRRKASTWSPFSSDVKQVQTSSRAAASVTPSNAAASNVRRSPVTNKSRTSATASESKRAISIPEQEPTAPVFRDAAQGILTGFLWPDGGVE